MPTINDGYLNGDNGDSLEALRSEIERLRAEVEANKHIGADAFLSGAQFWEVHKTGGTMWQSDQHIVNEEAAKHYPYTGWHLRYAEDERARLRAVLEEVVRSDDACGGLLPAKLREEAVAVLNEGWEAKLLRIAARTSQKDFGRHPGVARSEAPQTEGHQPMTQEDKDGF